MPGGFLHPISRSLILFFNIVNLQLRTPIEIFISSTESFINAISVCRVSLVTQKVDRFVYSNLSTLWM